jgi:hypothetical protein
MWLLPTYNRPDLLRQTLQHCVETKMTTPGVILVNGGDHKPYKSIPLPPNWRIIFRSENLGWAQGCQHLFERFPDEPWYGFFYDDMVPKTPEWDLRLLERLKPGGIVTAENNWHKPPRIQTAVLDGNLVREVGFITLPKTWSCFTDDFWEKLGEELGCWDHASDVVVETLNPRKGDMPMSEATTVAGYGPNNERLLADKQVYDAFLSARYETIREGVRARFRPKVRLGDRRLFIATPAADGNLVSQYVVSLSKTIRRLIEHGIHYELYFLDKCTIVHHARNRMVSKFLRSDCTHMLFIDADMGWPDYLPLEFLAHDKDVIAAAGCTKEEPPKFCLKIDQDTFKFDREKGLIRVRSVGTGFMMISRRCIEKMAKAYEAAAYHDVQTPGEMIPQIFWFDVVDNELVGEDFTFCNRWRAMGGEIWIDPNVTMSHVGTKEYTGNYAEAVKVKDDERRSEAA